MRRKNCSVKMLTAKRTTTQNSLVLYSNFDFCLRSLADCYPLLEVGDMLMMGNNPDPMCVFTYVQALCHSLCKIEKERKDKENEEKGKSAEGGEKDEGEPECQDEKEDDTETGGTGDEENASIGCEMEARDGGQES